MKSKQLLHQKLFRSFEDNVVQIRVRKDHAYPDFVYIQCLTRLKLQPAEQNAIDQKGGIIVYLQLLVSFSVRTIFVEI